MRVYGVHVCPTCFEQAPPDADGNPEYGCGCNWGERGLPVYIEVAVPTLTARAKVFGERRRAEARRSP